MQDPMFIFCAADGEGPGGSCAGGYSRGVAHSLARALPTGFFMALFKATTPTIQTRLTPPDAARCKTRTVSVF